jgi:NAD(P)-dependent dehydrogenase (short-subunit alcohol dehydrogenase family)/acyl carrier protein
MLRDADSALDDTSGTAAETVPNEIGVARRGQGPVGVLWLPGRGEDAPVEHVIQTLAVIQALGDEGIGAPLWALTRGAVSVGAPEPVRDAGQAPVWGLGRVVALEHPDRWGGLIDLPETPSVSVLERLAAVLADPAGEDQLALRAAGVFVRRVVHAPKPQTERLSPWRTRGRALVTGGTGAIGRRVARFLAGNGAEHLILTSRRGADTPDAEQLVAELEALGASVDIVSCDVSDRPALAALIEHEHEQGHHITTVVHAAGVGQLWPIDQTTPEAFEAVSAAKITGTVNLDELLADDPPENFIVFSSIASVWGVGNEGAYSAANTFLDTYAQQRTAAGRPITSIAWGPWDGGGMIPPELREPLARRGLTLLDPDIAMLGLQQVMDAGERSIALVDVDWERFARSFTSARPAPLLDALPEVRASREEARPAAETETDERSDLLKRLVALPAAGRLELVRGLVVAHESAVLGHARPDDIEVDRAFRDVGFDSITAVELRNRLNAATGLRLPATLIYDYPTPATLAEHIHRELMATTDTAEAAGDDSVEAAMRSMLATIPMSRLRDAGLIKPLMELAGLAAEDTAAGEADTADAIDAMAADDLIQLALGNSDA